MGGRVNGERPADVRSLGELAVRLSILAADADLPHELRQELWMIADDLAEAGDAFNKFVLRMGGEPR